MKKILFGCLGLVLLFGMFGCATIRYQITARKDPFQTVIVKPSTYSFKNNPQAVDPVIDKKIQYIILQSLTSNGWTHDSQGNGEYIIFVNYSIETKNIVSIKQISKYNRHKKKYEIFQEPYPETEYHKIVRIFVSHSSKPNEVFWSVECSSTGSTDDILLAAKYMVPSAINHFPEEGLWESKEDLKK